VKAMESMTREEREAALLSHLMLGGEFTLHLRAKRPACTPPGAEFLAKYHHSHTSIRWVETRPFGVVVAVVGKQKPSVSQYGPWEVWAGGLGGSFVWSEPKLHQVLLRVEAVVYSSNKLPVPKAVQSRQLAVMRERAAEEAKKHEKRMRRLDPQLNSKIPAWKRKEPRYR